MFDIIIIGAGTAGISAYKEAIKYTSNLLIVNKGSWDTTCARTGCMPSKALISIANRMNDIQHANELSLNVKAEIDTSAVMQQVRALRDRFTGATLKDVDSWNPAHKVSGEARFINADTIEVNGNQYQARSFILAVGSTPNIEPEWQQELGDRLVTSDEIFELESLPETLAIIGSGVIAIELAQAMHRLGVKTTVFTRSTKIGPLTSPNLRQLVQTEISKELDIKLKTLPHTVKKTTAGVTIQYQQDQEEHQLQVDYVLSAIGRSSNLSHLNLGNLDPQFSDSTRLPVDPQTKQLGDYPIFITGDAFTETPIQHEAAVESRLAVHNCLNYPKIQNIKTLIPLSIVFSSPEMARIGQNYANLSESDTDFVTGFVSYERQGRAILTGKNKGAAEVYVDKHTRKLLGAELFVEDAEHMAHLLSWIMGEALSIDEILKKPFFHPTLEEGLRTALKHARRQLDQSSSKP
ncbi:dihydrolipoyl dehydrogenase [Acinetobacter sp. WZC-1]|uniref:dihydrolipoyl dehydrogenase n=1 Tax=Acinetobacter sp. WZC-1 TaxID=3459034 RepID=UPI00403E30CC